MKTIAPVLALLLACAPALSQTSPYAGQEARPIKALSDDDQSALTQGRGMGFAKAAELNGYPGPMHVIELSQRLALTPEQLSASERAARRAADRSLPGAARLWQRGGSRHPFAPLT
jgi:hypothetical protein